VLKLLKLMGWAFLVWYQVSLLSWSLAGFTGIVLPEDSNIRLFFEAPIDWFWFYWGGGIANLMSIAILFQCKKAILHTKLYRQFLAACLISLPIYGPVCYWRLWKRES